VSHKGPWSHPFSSVYCRPVRVNKDPWGSATSLYADETQSRVSVRSRRRFMDAVQPAATQHDENRNSLVCVGSSAAPDSRRLDDGGLGCTVQPVRSVRDLGIHFDSNLPMRTNVRRTVSYAAALQLPFCSSLRNTAPCLSPFQTGWR